jgi:hypothetical protein
MRAHTKYKRSVLCAVGCIVFAYALNIIAIYTIYCGPGGDAAWINALYRVKEAYSNSIEGPKVLFISGSSGHFGFSAEQAELELEVPVVNFATHAALREYSYERAKRVLKSGDLVIVAPEYSQYSTTSVTNRVYSDYLTSFDKAYLRALPASNQFEIVQAHINPLYRLKRHLEYIRKREKDAKRKRHTKSLNTNGDDSKNLAYNGAALEPVILDQLEENAYVMQRITEFINWCRSNNIVVLATWPGTLELDDADEYQAYLSQYRDYWRSMDVEVLGKPEDFFYAIELFFDTEYHLNLEGVKLRTVFLLQLLDQSSSYQQWAEAPAHP